MFEVPREFKIRRCFVTMFGNYAIVLPDLDSCMHRSFTGVALSISPMIVHKVRCAVVLRAVIG